MEGVDSLRLRIMRTRRHITAAIAVAAIALVGAFPSGASAWDQTSCRTGNNVLNYGAWQLAEVFVKQWNYWPWWQVFPTHYHQYRHISYFNGRAVAEHTVTKQCAFHW